MDLTSDMKLSSPSSCSRRCQSNWVGQSKPYKSNWEWLQCPFDQAGRNKVAGWLAFSTGRRPGAYCVDRMDPSGGAGVVSCAGTLPPHVVWVESSGGKDGGRACLGHFWAFGTVEGFARNKMRARKPESENQKAWGSDLRYRTFWFSPKRAHTTRDAVSRALAVAYPCPLPNAGFP